MLGLIAGRCYLPLICGCAVATLEGICYFGFDFRWAFLTAPLIIDNLTEALTLDNELNVGWSRAFLVLPS